MWKDEIGTRVIAIVDGVLRVMGFPKIDDVPAGQVRGSRLVRIRISGARFIIRTKIQTGNLMSTLSSFLLNRED